MVKRPTVRIHGFCLTRSLPRLKLGTPTSATALLKPMGLFLLVCPATLSYQDTSKQHVCGFKQQYNDVGILDTGIKDDYKAIETLRNEGEKWVTAVQSGNSIGNSKILTRVTSGKNTDYYPVAGTDAHTIKATAFTPRTSQPHKAGSFSGEYQGIQGTFLCVGTNGCTSTPQTGENMFTLSPVGAADGSVGWFFKPGNEDSRVQGSPMAQWGWWLDTKGSGSTAEAGAGPVNIVYNFGTATAGANTANVRTALPVAGGATYTGKAHGQYAVVDGTDSASGAFEATAMLDAKFSGTDTKLSDKVMNFNVGSNWEITLKEADFSSTGNDFDGKTVWKTGDENGLGEGDWHAQFYAANTENAGDVTVEPTHALGGFTATDAGAQMVGAFGATPPKQ